jgi:predicted dehydrogenase
MGAARAEGAATVSEASIKVGIIGAGGIAHKHVRHYQELPWVEVVGVADIVPGKAREAAIAWGVPVERAYEDHRELLERVEMDAVSVCTYNMGHRAPTVDALAAGKHVLLEKPMAATLADAQAMVGFQPDFSTEHQAAKRIVDEGALGHVYYAEAVAHRRWGIPGGTFLGKETAGAGTLVDTGVYPLHTAIWLMGDPKPVSVSAVTADFLAKDFPGVGRGWGGAWTAADVQVEDFAAAFVRFENGAALAFKSAWASNADSLGRTFLMGTRGGLALDPLELYMNNSVGGLNLTAAPQGLKKIDDWAEKMHAFARAVRDNAPSPIDPRGVYLVNVIMDGILRSAELGYEVKVDAGYRSAPAEERLARSW